MPKIDIGAVLRQKAPRRIAEGAAMIRTKGEPGTGNVVEAVRHCRQVMDEIRMLCALPDAEVPNFAKECGAPLEICLLVRKEGRLPVVNFAAGGVATLEDVQKLYPLSRSGNLAGAISGRALYEGTLNLEEANAWIDAQEKTEKA